MRSADPDFEMPKIWCAGPKAKRPVELNESGRWGLVTAEHAACVEAQGGVQAVRAQDSARNRLNRCVFANTQNWLCTCVL